MWHSNLKPILFGVCIVTLQIATHNICVCNLEISSIIVNMGDKNINTNQRPPSVAYNPSHHDASAPEIRLDRRYSRIGDDYETLEQVTEALVRTGLESSNLIVGIDFTKSNEWTG
ncbi:hypothetical protein HanRHA438_Chr17g0840241 [Helianthus annuus]|nr:hypothetical protein HanHA89_Chr17g0728961 [Helianthus annuus]KAJ0669636.1 hypothetical protein HanPI659440_Chr17g0703371 [Helianthus annuus]KAJ0828711.1 hypothetical protein HanRHA438_Chr17g0840241 [Helianthus annuus]